MNVSDNAAFSLIALSPFNDFNFQANVGGIEKSIRTSPKNVPIYLADVRNCCVVKTSRSLVC
jgi:hypothetical protein